LPDQGTARRLRVGSISGVSGAAIPQAVGLAWAARLRRDDTVALALFGDGATSTGDFHNGVNFAGVFRAPVVFVCRNDGVALRTPLARQTASSTLAIKGIAY